MLAVVQWFAEFVCALGMLTSGAWLMNKKRWAAGGRFLALYLLFFSLSFLEFNLYWTPFYLHHPHLLLLTDPLTLTFAPLLYFHEYSDRRFQKRDYWLHSLLPIGSVLAYLPFYLSGPDLKSAFLQHTIWGGAQINAPVWLLYRLALITQIGAYSYAIFRKQRRVRAANRGAPGKLTADRLLLATLLLFGLFRIVWSVAILFVDYDLTKEMDNVIRIVLSFSVLVLFIRVISRVEVGRMPAGSRIGEKDADLLIGQLRELMAAEQPHTHRNLKMVDIASALQVSEHRLSQLLNLHLGVNFFEFVNQYRIETAKKRLINPDFGHYTIEAIARESGFNSKSAFNEAFKRIEGVTPSAYKKQQVSMANEAKYK